MGERPPQVRLKVEGPHTDFVPFFVQSFFFCRIFFYAGEETQESHKRKTGHGKTGYFHGNNNERKQHHIIHWEIQRSLVKILLFLSVGKLVLLLLSLFTIITSICLPIVGI